MTDLTYKFKRCFGCYVENRGVRTEMEAGRQLEGFCYIKNKQDRGLDSGGSSGDEKWSDLDRSNGTQLWIEVRSQGIQETKIVISKIVA